MLGQMLEQLLFGTLWMAGVILLGVLIGAWLNRRRGE